MAAERAGRSMALAVHLIAIHSFAVAAFLLLAPAWGARFGGWGELQTLFFARQAGAFHVVAAVAYLIEWRRYRGVTILLATKAIAVVFLLATLLADGGPWPVPISAAADAAMGGAVAWLRRGERVG